MYSVLLVLSRTLLEVDFHLVVLIPVLNPEADHPSRLQSFLLLHGDPDWLSAITASAVLASICRRKVPSGQLAGWLSTSRQSRITMVWQWLHVQ